MDDLVDMIVSDGSPSQISDAIKNILFDSCNRSNTSFYIIIIRNVYLLLDF